MILPNPNPFVRLEVIPPAGNDPIIHVEPDPPEGGPGPGFNVQEGDEFGNYPAPWIWRLIGGQRDRVVSISYKPVENAQGGVAISKWAMSDTKQCVSLEVDWRLIYLDENGVEHTAPPIDEPARRLPVYTRIPFPDCSDPKKEQEAAKRLDLVTRAYCYPVVASMDPNQKDQALWDNVSDVVETKVFVDYSQDKTTNLNYEDNRIRILYGEKHDKDYSLPEIESYRRLIFTGNMFSLGPKVVESHAGQRLMQINSKFTPLIEPPIFGDRTIAIRELQAMEPDQITAGLIRDRGIDPKDYLRRLQYEIEQELASCEEARATFIKDKGKNGKPSLGKKYKQFLKSIHTPKPMSTRLLENIGLGRFTSQKETYRSQRKTLLERHQAADRAYYAKGEELTAVAIGAPGADQQIAQIEQERAQLDSVRQEARKALTELEKTFNKGRSEFEGAIALVETLEQEAQKRQAQLIKLLHSPVDNGGFDINGAPNAHIPEAQRIEWRASLKKNEQGIEHNKECLRVAIKGIDNTGMSFDREKEKVSATSFGTNLSRIGTRMQALTNEIRGLQNRGLASFDAYNLGDPNDAALRKNHVGVLENMHRSSKEASQLLSQVDQDLTALERLITRPDISQADKIALETTKNQLTVHMQGLEEMRHNLSVWLRDFALPPLPPNPQNPVPL